jgi:hypothetical protein
MKGQKSYSEKKRVLLITIFFLLLFVGVTSFLSVMQEQPMRRLQANGLRIISGLILGVRLRYIISFRVHQILRTIRTRQA